MLANILIVAVLAIWVVIAVAFVVRNAKEAVTNHNPACLGCTQGCSSHKASRCHCQKLP